MSDWPKRRRTPLDVPHPNSPAGRTFDYSSLGVPHPNSPAGRNFDYSSSLGVPHPNSPAGRADLGRALNAMSQVRRDFYHLGGDYATNEMEAREKIRETIVRLLTRIKTELTTQVMAPLAITDPILFAQLSADRWLHDFRESRRDHEHFRDWLLEGLKQLVDAVDELKDLKLENVSTQVSVLSKIRRTAWSVFTDPDVARGFIDVVNAASLRARNHTLDDRQAALDKRYAYIKGELQRCIQSVQHQRPAGRRTTETRQRTASEQITAWSGRDKAITQADKGLKQKRFDEPLAKQAAPADPLTKWRVDKKDAIERALTNQREMLDAKRKELKTWDADAKGKFKKAFGKDDDASRDKMIARIDGMLKVNKSMTVDNFRPAEPPKVGRFAYIYPTDTAHTVYLDGAFDSAPDKGQDSKAGALAHEMSHFNDIGATKDKFKDLNNDNPIYGLKASRKLATDSPDNAMNHADSFEYYVEGVP